MQLEIGVNSSLIVLAEKLIMNEVAGRNTILVMCDQLSEIAYFVATTEETLVEGLARLLRDNM